MSVSFESKVRDSDLVHLNSWSEHLARLESAKRDLGNSKVSESTMVNLLVLLIKEEQRVQEEIKNLKDKIGI